MENTGYDGNTKCVGIYRIWTKWSPKDQIENTENGVRHFQKRKERGIGWSRGGREEERGRGRQREREGEEVTRPRGL